MPLQPQEWDSHRMVWQGCQGWGRGDHCSPLASVTVGAGMLGASGCAPGLTSVVQGAQQHMDGSASWALLSQTLREGWQEAGAMATLHSTALLHPSPPGLPPLPARPSQGLQARQEPASYWVGAGGGRPIILTMACRN